MQGSGGGSQRADQEKTKHAFGLPWGELRKPTHRKATAGRLAPFLPGPNPCCTVSSARPPAPRLSRRSFSGSPRERAHLDPGCARIEQRPGSGGRRGSGGQDVVDEANRSPRALPLGAKAPRTPRSRAVRSRPTCCPVSRTRRSSGTTGRPKRFDAASASSRPGRIRAVSSAFGVAEWARARPISVPGRPRTGHRAQDPDPPGAHT